LIEQMRSHAGGGSLRDVVEIGIAIAERLSAGWPSAMVSKGPA